MKNFTLKGKRMDKDCTLTIVILDRSVEPKSVKWFNEIIKFVQKSSENIKNPFGSLPL